MTYLGCVVGQCQVWPVGAKVQAVEEFTVPTTRKVLICFLGLIEYYHSFCKNFSTVVAPLTDLLQGEAIFAYSLACQRTFEQVKSLLCIAPILAALHFDRPFNLCMNGSHGCRLRNLFVVVLFLFFSKKSFQENYSVVEKETLMLILSLKHFDVYVSGSCTPLAVYTDHNPLTFIKPPQCPNQQLAHWSLFFQSLTLEMCYVKVADIVVDTLSRALVE